MVRFFRWSAGVAVVAALCGSGGAPGIAGAATSPLSDQSAVAGATLTQTDFPTDGGWDGEALGAATQEIKDKQDSALSAFAPCGLLRASYRDLYAAPAVGTTLYQNNSGSVADTVVMFKTAKEAAMVAATYRSTKTSDCFKQYWASLYDASYNAKVSTEKLPALVTKAAGGTAGVRIKSEYQQDGTPKVAYFDFLAVQKGRAAGAFTFRNDAEPFPTALEAKLLATVAGRLPK